MYFHVAFIKKEQICDHKIFTKNSYFSLSWLYFTVSSIQDLCEKIVKTYFEYNISFEEGSSTKLSDNFIQLSFGIILISWLISQMK